MRKILFSFIFILFFVFGIIYVEGTESVIDEIGTHEGSKIYTLNNKEYIVSCPFTSHVGEADFTVNGERASSKPGWRFMSAGDKWVFSDGSTITSLGTRKVVRDISPKVLNYCKFKLEALAEAVKNSCTPGWICEGSYKIYISSDCFKSNKKLCNYGCSVGECNQPTPPSCSTGWMCKNNDEKAYRNADCTWSSVEYCSYGCANGECIPKQTATGGDSLGKVCSAGWICKDGATKAYRSSDCTISSETRCSYGCTNSKCKGSPSTGAAITDTTGKIECGMLCWIGRLFTSWFTG